MRKFDTGMALAALRPLADGGNKAAARILRCAAHKWAGDVSCALQDAADGALGGDASAFARALPEDLWTREETASEAAERQAVEARVAARQKAADEAAAAEAEAHRKFDAAVQAAIAAGRIHVKESFYDFGGGSYGMGEDYRIVWDEAGVFGCKMPDDEEFQPVKRGLYAVPAK